MPPLVKSIAAKSITEALSSSPWAQPTQVPEILQEDSPPLTVLDFLREHSGGGSISRSIRGLKN